MPLMNRLYDSVSQDAEFLTSTLKSAAEFDDFTANLLEIYGDVRKLQNRKEEMVLGIHRSDYMLDQPSNRLLQARCVSYTAQHRVLKSSVLRWS